MQSNVLKKKNYYDIDSLGFEALKNGTDFTGFIPEKKRKNSHVGNYTGTNMSLGNQKYAPTKSNPLQKTTQTKTETTKSSSNYISPQEDKDFRDAFNTVFDEDNGHFPGTKSLYPSFNEKNTGTTSPITIISQQSEYPGLKSLNDEFLEGLFWDAKEENKTKPVLHPKYDLNSDEPGTGSPVQGAFKKPYNGNVTSENANAQADYAVSDGFFEWFGKNAYAGLASVNNSFGNTFELIVPDTIGFGLDKKVKEYYSEEYDRISNEAKKSSKSRGEIYEFSGDLIKSIVETIPDMALVLMSGGISAPSVLAPAASRTGATTVMGQMLKNPEFLMTYIKNVGDDYEKAKENGLDDVSAILNANVSALARGIIDSGGGFGSLSNLSKVSKKSILNNLQSLARNTSDDVLKGLADRSIDEVFYEQSGNKTLPMDESSVINPKYLTEDMLKSIILNGILDKIKRE